MYCGADVCAPSRHTTRWDAGRQRVLFEPASVLVSIAAMTGSGSPSPAQFRGAAGFRNGPTTFMQ